jgi:hypothetical protein
LPPGGSYDGDSYVGVVHLWEAGIGKLIRDWALCHLDGGRQL